MRFRLYRQVAMCVVVSCGGGTKWRLGHFRIVERVMIKTVSES